MYTTVCPVQPPDENPGQPAIVIGVLITIIVDITIEININNGVKRKYYYLVERLGTNYCF